MSDCLFCKIAKGEIPAKVVHQTDDLLAFEDIAPQAPTHVLIIPRQHIATVNDLEEESAGLVGELFLAAKAIAAERGHEEGGYRLVMNCGEGAGQSVFHLHLHLLAGRALQWPPG
ncbi:MAG: histidine triad nucleotide-binding protein [Deltaproteobacteria bacterium]|nr:histidine triad nucleotide-binding protein [Deltaproteobacteria bacterium]